MQQNDATPDSLLDRRAYLRLAGTLAAGATAGLAGCAETLPGSDSENSNGDGSSSTGLLSTAVSDDPGDIGDFESCIVTLDGIWVGPKTDGSGENADEEDEEEEEDDTEDSDDEESGVESGTGDGEAGQGDGGNGSPEQAGSTGNSATDDTASGSQDDETDGTNGTDPDGDVDDDGSDSTDDDGSDSAEDETEGSDDEGDGDDADDADDGSGGRTYYEFEEPQKADLTELQGDAQQLVGEHELPVGTYQFLQLDIGGISGTLTDGSEASVETPGNAPLKFNQSFDVREGYRTTFLADFTPVKRGNGSYLFKPVATETEVSYVKIESDDSTNDDGNVTDGSGNTTDGSGNTTDGSGNTTDAGDATGSGNTTNSTNTTSSGGNESTSSGNDTSV
ncbi:hypothetical protein GCM10028857_12210 [Salinarchaeum chitinilyticum]